MEKLYPAIGIIGLFAGLHGIISALVFSSPVWFSFFAIGGSLFLGFLTFRQKSSSVFSLGRDKLIHTYMIYLIFGILIEFVGRFILGLWKYPSFDLVDEIIHVYLIGYPFVFFFVHEFFKLVRMKISNFYLVVILTAVINAFLHELPNTFAWEWVYTMPFPVEIFRINLLVIAGWIILVAAPLLVEKVIEKPFLKWYGLLGILMIALVELNFLFRVEPFIFLSFPIVWFGYIFVVDSLVHRIRGSSLINDRFPQFLGMAIISGAFWWFFEFLNIPVQNWRYIGIEHLGIYADLFAYISFATVLPALFETVELIRSIHRPKIARKKASPVSSRTLHLIMALGLLCFLLPILFPKYFYALIWGSFFLLLDPLNYVNKQPSIIGHIRKGNKAIVYHLLLAGIIIGFLWEFWNFWSPVKWVYEIPFVTFLKIFEMPLLGYIGYFPFALELYAMYWFTRSLFMRKEKLIAE